MFIPFLLPRRKTFLNTFQIPLPAFFMLLSCLMLERMNASLKNGILWSIPLFLLLRHKLRMLSIGLEPCSLMLQRNDMVLWSYDSLLHFVSCHSNGYSSWQMVLNSRECHLCGFVQHQSGDLQNFVPKKKSQFLLYLGFTCNGCFMSTYKHILQYLKLPICVILLMPLCPENHRVMPKITNRKLLFPSIASPGWVFSVINMDGKQVLESVGE